jgi:dynamin 1-like protein
MEINYLFTNDAEYLNNFTTFIPKNQRPVAPNNQPGQPGQPGQGAGNNQNEIRPQPPIDAKTLFVKEIRNRIEAYFKLIVRNLRDSIPKLMGNYLIKEIEENMQLKLYNKLYNAREMTDLLCEPESVAERRKELNDLIKVMRNAQKIIRRDPDLMSVMEININDEDITSHAKKEEPKKEAPKPAPAKSDPPKPALATNQDKKKKGGYGNLFG